MYTLGYSFRPWTDPKSIADGPAIMDYLKGAIDEGGIEKHIRFRRKATRAVWSSAEARWQVTVENADDGTEETYRARFIHMCTGYYNYHHGYVPRFENEGAFKGSIIHPQHWPEDLDYRGKKVVIIGSGATAVTLVPAMAETAEHVTMLQRSPTYIIAMPAEDKWANRFRRVLPARLAYGMTRWKNVLFGRWFFWYCRTRPERAKAFFLDKVREELGDDFDIETHFTPRYNPWEQRVCLAPDGDFFEAMRNGTASVVTEHIDRFTENGILLKSGETLEADIIVRATGLDLAFFGGMDIVVDNRPVVPGETVSYKGMMFGGVPNFALSTGYTNASWTLKCDLTSAYVCRLLNHMDKKGFTQALPQGDMESVDIDPILNLSSGYIARRADDMPKQGKEMPWRMHHNYLLDILHLGYGSVNDTAMQFSRPDA